MVLSILSGDKWTYRNMPFHHTVQYFVEAFMRPIVINFKLKVGDVERVHCNILDSSSYSINIDVDIFSPNLVFFLCLITPSQCKICGSVLLDILFIQINKRRYCRLTY